MTARHSRSLLAMTAVAALAVTLRADVGAPAPPLLQRFLAVDDPAPQQYRALRHLAAENSKFDLHAWMDVWTEADARGFRYQIVSEGGSDYIRSHVFREALETERKLSAAGAPGGASLTPVNYIFEDRGASLDGLASLGVKPRRRDVLLIDGAIFLRPGDAELVRVEGELAKPPSFWTRQVKIVRSFQRFAGVRLPVSIDAAANIRFAGHSTFRMTYEYETVNAERVGTPQLRASSRD